MIAVLLLMVFLPPGWSLNLTAGAEGTQHPVVLSGNNDNNGTTALTTTGNGTVDANSSLFYGTVCRPDDVLPGCPDLFAGVCLPGVQPGCILYSQGTFQPPLVSMSPRDPSLHVNLSGLCSSGMVMGGYYPPTPDIWTADSCALHMPSPGELLHLYMGKTLVFAGDSIMRQIFWRLVNWIRRPLLHAAVIDRTYHADAAYYFNATHDIFAVLASGKGALATPPPGAHQVRIVFRWSRWEVEPVHLRKFKPHLLFLGLFFWPPTTPRPRKALLKLRLPAYRVFWVSIPPLKPGVAVHGRPFQTAERNLEAYKDVHDLVQYVAFDSILYHSPWGHVPDGIHLQCSTKAYQHSPVTTGLRINNYGVGNCTDYNNLSVLRLMLTMALRSATKGRSEAD